LGVAQKKTFSRRTKHENTPKTPKKTLFGHFGQKGVSGKKRCIPLPESEFDLSNKSGHGGVSGNLPIFMR